MKSIFCLSEHSPDDQDGLLSMWRGYGGNGTGAALVFNTSKLNVLPSSPLIIAQVIYGSPVERLTWFRNVSEKLQNILRSYHIPDNRLYLAAYQLFCRLQLFALFTKHHGFREEREWGVVYMSDRDIEGRLKGALSLCIGSAWRRAKAEIQNQSY